jgi:hypothetical protein
MTFSRRRNAVHGVSAPEKAGVQRVILFAISAALTIAPERGQEVALAISICCSSMPSRVCRARHARYKRRKSDKVVAQAPFMRASRAREAQEGRLSHKKQEQKKTRGSATSHCLCLIHPSFFKLLRSSSDALRRRSCRAEFSCGTRIKKKNPKNFFKKRN